MLAISPKLNCSLQNSTKSCIAKCGMQWWKLHCASLNIKWEVIFRKKVSKCHFTLSKRKIKIVHWAKTLLKKQFYYHMSHFITVARIINITSRKSKWSPNPYIWVRLCWTIFGKLLICCFTYIIAIKVTKGFHWIFTLASVNLLPLLPLQVTLCWWINISILSNSFSWL